ncbi:2'-5' RNA ligase family protein [Kineosporia sp. J2-2]|uniref:2'-5' RNA ligase family protein n=1 Tax=Kineosporia corallincola TaxID=2835133 RepID=A0ABS5TE18_9ACTN|nr:2'-5' RNA ligase family protein [Kineosporia corallincola]MBT0769322.1 2'-5' RNA ligase family protein [Kineosporia corallincola]
MSASPVPEQSALIVPVPETEPVVGPYRATMDANAAKGVPAHVTVLYPFLSPSMIDDDVRTTLRDLFATHSPFEVSFREVRWFGDAVTWLAPEPNDAFRRLTAAVWGHFPDTPPYAGEHDGDNPHLTIGHGLPVEVLRQAADEVTARLPVDATVGAVHLIAGSDAPDSWRTLDVFTLGDPG